MSGDMWSTQRELPMRFLVSVSSSGLLGYSVYLCLSSTVSCSGALPSIVVVQFRRLKTGSVEPSRHQMIFAEQHVWKRQCTSRATEKHPCVSASSIVHPFPSSIGKIIGIRPVGIITR